VRDLFLEVAVITGQDYTLSWRSSGSQPSTPAGSFSRPSPTQASASDRCGKRPVVDQGREPTESYFKSSSRNRSGDAQTSSRSQEGKIML